MKLFHYISTLLSGGMLLFSSFAISADTGGTEMDFSGSLVAQPCWMNPEFANRAVDMGEIPNADLYYNPHSRSFTFTIILSGCDFGEAGEGTVTTRFEGNESAELPGYLAMSTAGTGAAIRILTQQGAPLPLGQESAPVHVSNGGNVLNFNAYVQAEPTALADRTVELGDFTATATFFLDYP
ncbi:fimbrial protein [Dryocola clanedunensis]